MKRLYKKILNRIENINIEMLCKEMYIILMTVIMCVATKYLGIYDFIVIYLLIRIWIEKEWKIN